jgi:hypothetical protein
MTNPLRIAAKAGDPKALEAMMNQSFGSQGVTVRVTNTGSCLKILLRGPEPPDPRLANSIKKGLRSINPDGFTKVLVKAEVLRTGVVWNAQWNLPSLNDEEAEVIISKKFYKLKKNSPKPETLSDREGLPNAKFPANSEEEIGLGQMLQEIHKRDYEEYKRDPDISKSINAATEQLENGEVVEELIIFLIFSAMRIFSQDKYKLCGVSLATNRRVIKFALNSLSGFEMESLPYSKISSIEFKEGNFTDEIELFTSGNSLEIQKIVKGNTKPFVDFVNRKINDGYKNSEVQNDARSLDIFLKIEKLAELRDKGILTSDEFEAKKQEWLREI